MSGRQDFAPKLVGTTGQVTFEFLGELAVGETISTEAVTAAVHSGTDAAPSALIDGAAASSGTQVTQALTGGEEGVIYKLTCTITTSAGNTLVKTGFLAVIPDLP